MAKSITDRLSELGIILPEAAAPVASYVAYLEVAGILYTSGQLPMESGQVAVTGKLGADLDVEAGRRAAHLCAINILAQAQAALGDLERVRQVIRLTGFVNATPEFTDHPTVINAASELIANVLGDRGRHTRDAVGVSSLPLGAAVEIDAMIEVAA